MSDERLVVNKETGEIEMAIEPGDRILKAKSIEYLQKDGINFNKDKSFVKLYDDVIPLLDKYLTPQEIKYLIVIAQHVSFSDCVIRKTNNNVSEAIGISEFAKIHDYNYDSARKVFKSLKKKGLIIYVEVETIFPEYIGKVKNMYLVNPYIYFRGENLNETVKALFDQTGWKDMISGYIE